MEKNRRKLIVCDLDGTLLNDKVEISKESITIIKKIINQGHIFCLATGRPPRASINYYNQLGLNTVMVNYNGAKIWHPNDNTFNDINFIFEKENAIKILINDNIKKYAKNILIENNDGCFFLKKPTNNLEKAFLLSFSHLEDHVQINFIDGDFKNIKSGPYSMLIQISDENKTDEVIREIKAITSTFVVRKWSLYNMGSVIEINTFFSNKGTALSFLSCYYGIRFDRCYAFGDGENDLEMLKKANHGYAMKNGSSSTKIAARYLTKNTNNEDGVISELKNIFNIN